MININDYKLETLIKMPEGRGLPKDIRKTGANCGPSALAAYLNLSTREVIHNAKEWTDHGWISIKPMLRLLEFYEKPHQSLKINKPMELPSQAFKEYDICSGLAFIQFKGPKNQEKYSGWKSWSQEYFHTHWIAYDEGLVYDVNALCQDTNSSEILGSWMPEKFWLHIIVPEITPLHGAGHYVRNVLIPKSNSKKK